MPIPGRISEVKFNKNINIDEIDKLKVNDGIDSHERAGRFYNNVFSWLDVIKNIANKEGFAEKHPELKDKLNDFGTEKKINSNIAIGVVLAEKEKVNELVSDVLTSGILGEVMAEPEAAGLSNADAAAFYVGLVMPFAEKDGKLANYFFGKSVEKNTDRFEKNESKYAKSNAFASEVTKINNIIESKPELKDAVEELTFTPEQKKRKADMKAEQKRKEAEEYAKEHPKFDRLKEVKFKENNNFAKIDGLQLNSDIEDHKRTAEFYNNVYAFLDVVRDVANKKEFAKEYPELTKKLDGFNTKARITEKTAKGALMADGSKVAEAVTDILQSGILVKIMENPEKAGLTPEQTTAFHEKLIKPFAKDDCKMAAHFINKHYNAVNKGEINYDDKTNAKAEFEREVNIIDGLMKNRQPAKEDNLIINDDEPEEIIPEKKVKKNAWRDDVRRQLYERKHKPNGLNYNDAVKSFRSTRILGMGSSTTEHDILNESLNEYKSFQETNQNDLYTYKLMGMSQDKQIELLAEKVYKLETLSRQAKSYIDIKTNKGRKIPGTPAGTDRLLGAFEIDRNAKELLKETEAQIKELGLGDSLADFKENKSVQMTTLGLINKKISNIAEFNQGNPVREVEERYLLAQQSAYKIQLDNKHLDLAEKFIDLNTNKLAKTLSHDKQFNKACKEIINDAKRVGKTVAEDSNRYLVDSYKENVRNAEKLDVDKSVVNKQQKKAAKPKAKNFG